MADNKNEMACVYAALVLHDGGVEISEAKIKALVEAAGVDVEPYWPSLFAKAAGSLNMDDLISSIGSAPAAGGAAAPGAAAADAPKEEEKQESEEEEEEEEMDFDLFD